MLDVDDPISAYLPDYPNGDVITIHHLLSHSSGIPNLENFPDFVATMREPATPSELIERFADMPLEFAPGDQWAYSSSNHIVLAVIIVAFGWALQHSALPLMFDWQWAVYRFGSSLAVGIVFPILYLRIRRLLPLIIAHWAANFVSVLMFVVLPLMTP